MHLNTKKLVSISEVLITISLFSLSAGQLSAIIKYQGINFYLFDLMIALSSVYFIFLLTIKKKFSVDSRFLIFTLIALYTLTITCFKTANYPFSDFLKVLFYFVRFSSYFVFSYLIFQLIKYEILEIYKFKQILTWNFYFLTVINIIQIIFYRDLSFLAIYGWDPHINRLTGAFLDPNFMAFYLCLYYVLNQYLLKSKLIEYLSIFSIFLTVSRNGILTFLIIFIILNIGKIYKILGILLISILLILLSPNLITRFSGFYDSNDSSYIRIISWEQALKITALIGGEGIGLNNYKNYSNFLHLFSISEKDRNHATGTDSSILFIYTTLGIIGVTLISLFFTLYLKNVYNIAVIIGLFFNSMFINSLFYPQTAVLLFIVLGGGILLNKNIQKNSPSQNS